MNEELHHRLCISKICLYKVFEIYQAKTRSIAFQYAIKKTEVFRYIVFMLCFNILMSIEIKNGTRNTKTKCEQRETKKTSNFCHEKSNLLSQHISLFFLSLDFGSNHYKIKQIESNYIYYYYSLGGS